MKKFLFRKLVDKSLLKDGLTIPKTVHDELQSQLGFTLSKGEQKEIRIRIGQAVFDAKLINVNFDEQFLRADTFQIRYAQGMPICQELKHRFSFTANALANAGSNSIDEKQEFLDVFALPNSELEFRCYPKSMKADFFRYLGDEKDLTGYQRSYKLVLLKAIFENWNPSGEYAAARISEVFQKYYITRKQQGLEPDKNVDPIIENVDTSSIKSIYNLILTNPYNAIQGKGFLTKVTKNEKEYFKLPEQLVYELAEIDIAEILRILTRKLELYYNKIGMNITMNEDLRKAFTRITNEYVASTKETFTSHPIGNFFRSDIPAILLSTGLINSSEYVLKGSVGQGNWAAVPWFGIFDKQITTSATQGVYVVYLLAADGNTLYLTFNQGFTQLNSDSSKKETIRLMRQNAERIVSQINARGFAADEDINLGDGLTGRPEFYQKGTIFYKAYHKGNIPPEAELQDDLRKMMEIYREYAGKQQPTVETEIEEIDVTGGEEEVPVKETLERIKKYIATKGFSYEDGLLENFYLSLKSKPFVILAGTSGTGKTRLVKLFAEALGATTSNGRYKMVSVRPDWSDSSDLFGHVDLNGHFCPGAIIDFVKDAAEHTDKPYFLCLDEMNLARVEYYLSDFLSVIETRDKEAAGKITSDPLVPANYFGSDDEAKAKYGTLLLPENLYVIGTVNMDETTFPFSRKVLDRANTIEFSYVDLMPHLGEAAEEVPSASNVSNAFLKTEYLLLAQCAEDAETVNEYCSELQQINKILQKASAHVGYRVRDEIVFYLLNNKKNELLPENEAMDNELMQKILPRIQGSSASIKNMLCDLFKHCAGDYEGYQTQSDDVSAKMMKALASPACKYKCSAEKIAFMVRRFEEDGFTSYWL